MLELIGAASALILYYMALCAISPFGACRRCKGERERRGRRGRMQPCRPCRTTGRRLRIGRRIHNYAVATHRDGTR